MIARPANKMQPGIVAKDVPDALMSSVDCKEPFPDLIGPRGYKGSEMRIMLRGVRS
jgi:hypothetical protein